MDIAFCHGMIKILDLGYLRRFIYVSIALPTNVYTISHRLSTVYYKAVLRAIILHYYIQYNCIYSNFCSCIYSMLVKSELLEVYR